MTKIDIDRFICDFINVIDDKFALLHGDIIQHTLKQQGLVYKNGEIVEIEEISGNQEKISPNKPQTIKFNKEHLMEIAKPESIEEKYDIDIEKMVKEYRESLNSVYLPLGYYPSQLNEFTKIYKKGLEDMLKLIKEGGE